MTGNNEVKRGLSLWVIEAEGYSLNDWKDYLGDILLGDRQSTLMARAMVIGIKGLSPEQRKAGVENLIRAFSGDYLNESFLQVASDLMSLSDGALEKLGRAIEQLSERQ